MTPGIYIGTAGWSIPKAHAALFPPPDAGTHLQRYAETLNCAEINSSFYRPHRRATYERWASSVPEGFRFSVKMPRAVTHEARLVGVEAELDAYLEQVNGLGGKLGVVLAQLPPSLRFDHETAERFLAELRTRHCAAVVIEPRHATWFSEPASALLKAYRVGRAGADPAVVDAAAHPGGDQQTIYLRLHGSPDVYYSDYDDKRLRLFADRLRAVRAAAAQSWCIFDNTARGAATSNALRTAQLMSGK